MGLDLISRFTDRAINGVPESERVQEAIVQRRRKRGPRREETEEGQQDGADENGEHRKAKGNMNFCCCQTSVFGHAESHEKGPRIKIFRTALVIGICFWFFLVVGEAHAKLRELQTFQWE